MEDYVPGMLPPLTDAQLERVRAAAVIARRVRSEKQKALEVREIDDCPATRHRHSWRGWRYDGCRCPSTRKAHDRKKEQDREASRRYRDGIRPKRQDPRQYAQADLRKADRTDAESIALGYRMARATIHTRALAVKIMRARNPELTDRQVAWKLTAAGQGRMVSRHGAPPVYEQVSVRQVQRIQAALDYKKIRHPRRDPAHMDRSHRTR